MATLRGVSIFLTTKSSLVSRDAALFLALAKHNRVHVTVTVTTTNRSLARLTEPFAPSPEMRLKAVAKLAEAGVSVGVMASPILPLITDSEANLLAVAKAAEGRPARNNSAPMSCFCSPRRNASSIRFWPNISPQHLGRYRRSFRDGAHLSGNYPERMRTLVRDIRSEVGLAERDLDMPPPPPLA